MELYSAFKRIIINTSLIAAILSITSVISEAKTVNLKWSLVTGATSYEVQISQNDKTISEQKLGKTEFQAELDPGAYSYRVRAIDSLNRGGRWSIPKDLIVTAPAPILEQGETPEKVEYSGAFPGVSFKWKKVDFVKLYEIEVKNKITGESVYKKETPNTKFKIDQLPPGQFEYSVTSVIESKGKKYNSKNVKPLSLAVVENKNSEPTEVALAKIEQPQSLYPNGTVSLSEDPSVKLEWKKVKGAEKYEVILEAINGRSPASESRVRTWVIDKNEIDVPISRFSHKYRWKVRAIASSGDQSALSESEFNSVHDQGVGKVGAGSIQLGGNNMQFSGRVENASSSSNNTSTGMGWGFNIKGDYWFSKTIGVEAFYENLFFSTQNTAFSLNFLGAMAKTRWRFSQSVSAWKFSFKFGLGSSSFFKSNPGGGNSVIPYYGFATELDATKSLSEDFDLNFGLLYFLPVSASDGSSIVRFMENGVLRPHVEITHHLSPKVSAALGVRYDVRQLYAGSGLNPDRFLGTSAAIDVSIKYNFGDVNNFKVSERLSEGTRKIANINTAEPDLVANDPLKANHGVLEIAGGIMPMTTSTINTPVGLPTTTNQVSGTSFRNGVRGEYWFGRYSGVSLDLESSYYLLNQSDRTAIEFGGAYNQRFYINALGGLILIGKLGVAQKSWLQINTNGTADVRTGIGPTAEIEFRKLWNKTMVSILGQYQYPSIGVVRAKVFYPIYKSLEFGVEGFWESQLANQSSTVTITRQNYGALGLLRYRFGVTY